MSSVKKIVKVEVGDFDHYDGEYNFVVHYKGEKINSIVKLSITVDDLCEKYLNKKYDIDQFQGSMKIFVEHKNKKVIETVKHITHDYFYNGDKTPISQAQEISDWLDDDTIEWEDGEWKFEGEIDDDDEDDKVDLKSDSDDDDDDNDDDKVELKSEVKNDEKDDEKEIKRLQQKLELTTDWDEKDELRK